jgi:hypothetical protein
MLAGREARRASYLSSVQGISQTFYVGFQMKTCFTGSTGSLDHQYSLGSIRYLASEMTSADRTILDVDSPNRRGDFGGFLFSPSSTYPDPVAYLLKRDAVVAHSWSHCAEQPDSEDGLPNYLKGWNHVEVDSKGNLYAIVPLRAVLKLSSRSELLWVCPVAAHHDIALCQDGTLLTLAERPRRIEIDGHEFTILDNLIVTIDQDGRQVASMSLFDILMGDVRTAELVKAAVVRRAEAFKSSGWPTDLDAFQSGMVSEVQMILHTGEIGEDLWSSCRRLRGLPGSPCDVLHANTLEFLEQPRGQWGRRPVLVCCRELDLITIIDLEAYDAVRWIWGPGILSGPHQPSLRPDGQVLVFDNGVRQKRSRLMVVDPRRNEVFWHWPASPTEAFFCPLAGGAETLASGNILVTNSTAGAAFELSPEGKKQWEVTLTAELLGRTPGRVSIYRFAAVAEAVVANLAAGEDADCGVNDTSEFRSKVKVEQQ